jgi:hypothetical protein
MSEMLPSKTYDELAVQFIESGDIGAVNSGNARAAVRLFAVWLDKRSSVESECVRSARTALERLERQLRGYAEYSPANELHRIAVEALGGDALIASERHSILN